MDCSAENEIGITSPYYTKVNEHKNFDDKTGDIQFQSTIPQDVC